MKATLAAGGLAGALAFVAGAIEKRIVTPILGDCRIEVRDGLLTLSATNLDFLLTAEIAAPEADSGVAIAPCTRLAKLAAELPADAEVTLAFDGERLSVKSGRGRWSLPTMAPEDFPVLSAPDAAAAQFVVPQAEAQRLIKRAAFAISSKETRYYLGGLYLTRRGSRLVCVATDGHRLAEVQSDVDAGMMPAVIVPRRAIDVVEDIARVGDVTVRVNERCIEFSGDGLCCISKLIDATYPDYVRVVPDTSDNKVTVNRAALLAAICRLKAVSDAKTPTIGMIWDGIGLLFCLAREPDVGTEEIDTISNTGSAQVAASATYLIELLESLDGETVQLDHGAANAPLRITRGDEADTVMVVMPMQWLAPSADAPIERPQRRAKG